VAYLPLIVRTTYALPFAWSNNASVKTGHAFQVKLVGEGVTTKSFNTVESLLPAELMPGVVERVHEPRIADLLPTVSSTTLNYEFISDNTTSNTVSGITAEGAAAPDCRVVVW
jgi:hypothetical protein